MNIDDDLIDDLEFIRSKINSFDAQIEIPASIYSKNLINLLDDIEQTEQIEQMEQDDKNNVIKPTKHFWKKPFAYAAMFALIFGVYYASDINSKSSPSENMPMLMSVDDKGKASRSVPHEVYSKDYTQIRKAIGASITNMEKNIENRVYSSAAAAPAPAAGAMENGGMGGGGGETGGANSVPSAVRNETTKDVYGTNTQVKGIDESDIVKTDGNNLYVHRTLENGEQEIAIVESSSLKKVSEIPLAMNSSPEIYLLEERLVVLNSNDQRRVGFRDDGIMPISEITDDIFPSYNRTSIFQNDSGGQRKKDRMDQYLRRIIYDNNVVSSAVIFDVSDSENPTEVRRFEQDGAYVSSRVYDGVLYMVSTKYISADARYDDTMAYEILPVVGDSMTGKSETLAANCIAILPNNESVAYGVVSAIDISDATKSVTTKAVLGNVDEIYMSQENVYLTSNSRNYVSNEHNTQKTNIVKMAVDGMSVEYLANGEVEGYIESQFSMDEYKDNFRIATTSYKDGTTQNNIYVLDEFLQPIGAIEGLAEGEKIYSVRYMGDKAYAVTFKQIDPLFAIDLSNPRNPKVLGQLKIPGFSEYLHPLNENTLIGFGVNTSVMKDGTVRNDGLKLSLFDVSDPVNPVESNTFYLGNAGTSSEALYNHKAFMFNKSRQMIGFPITINKEITDNSIKDEWSRQYSIAFSGYMLMNVSENGGFKSLVSIPSSDKNVNQETLYRDGLDISRGVYIDNKIYTISNSKIMEYSLDDYKKLREVKL